MILSRLPHFLFWLVMSFVLHSPVTVSATPIPKDTCLHARSAEPTPPATKRAFLETCIGHSRTGAFALTEGRILNGTCHGAGASDNWRTATIDLNAYIKNENGILKWKVNGNYKKSCASTGLRHMWFDDGAINQVYLWANCYDIFGDLKRSEIRLNDRIHNWMGDMVYDTAPRS